jgi:hypothetical protein
MTYSDMEVLSGPFNGVKTGCLEGLSKTTENLSGLSILHLEPRTSN